MSKTLLIHGTEDPQVGVAHSRKLYQQLADADQEVVFYELVDGDHGGQLYWSQEVLGYIKQFILGE